MSTQPHDVPAMIRIDRLVERHEPPAPAALPIAAKALLARYGKVPSAVVSDVLREHALLEQAFPGSLVALRPERSVAGIAFTVKSSPNTRITGEMTIRGQMLDALTEDAFVVWDTSGDTRGTMWGGVMTATVVAKGVRGAVIDGGIRDTAQILAKDFPVYYRYRSPNGSLGRCQITHYEIPVRVGDVFVRPGDIIVGDADGAVCVPREMALPVLVRAEEILGNEERIFAWVDEGHTIAEITDRGGYF
jgi:4-hydroxy-4-methyl-2-oxoglutarate aldolase